MVRSKTTPVAAVDGPMADDPQGVGVDIGAFPAASRLLRMLDSGHDDLPHLLITGAGWIGAERDATAKAMLDATLLEIRARTPQRPVIADLSARDPSVGDAIRALRDADPSLDVVGRSERVVCVVRGVDALPARAVSALKQAMDVSRGRWWILSSSRSDAPPTLAGHCLRLTARCLAPVHCAEVRLENLQDVGPAVASGAPVSVIVHAFLGRALRGPLPAHDAVEMAARLDADLARSQRTLMLPVLVEHALRALHAKERSQCSGIRGFLVKPSRRRRS